MQLSLTQHRSWAVLLPLLSSMLLWKDVASGPVCKQTNGQCQLRLEYYFNQERGLSEKTNHLTLELFNELFEEYISGPGIQNNIPLLCYNYSFPIADITEGQENQPKVLLKVTISVLVGWNNILKRILLDTADLESNTDVAVFISKIRKITENFTVLTKLLNDVKSFLKLVDPEFGEDEAYPVSEEELPSLHQLYKPPPVVFFQALFGCLNYNAEKVATHIKILRCQMLPRKC